MMSFSRLSAQMSGAVILSVLALLALVGCPHGDVAPTASFTATPISGTVPLTVIFSDTSLSGSSDITSWAWDFGDETTSDVQNPTHVYEAGGTYTVSLTVTSDDGVDTSTKTGYITVTVVTTADWFVKSDGSGDGTSWDDAFGSIQDAVDAAFAAGGGEVWVKMGVYTKIARAGSGVVVMAEGVDLYGGFSGDETVRENRDWETNETIIDGDLADRCVYGANSAVLDGFTLKNGSAAYGAGLYNVSAAPTVANCLFTGNTGLYGAGMYNEASSPTILHCVFTENGAVGGVGCGIYNNNASSPTVDRSIFSHNNGSYGVGMYNFGSAPAITNCLFFSNNGSAGAGGGMYNHSSSATVFNCTFSKNTGSYGGAIFNSSSIPTITNCILWGDTAANSGNEIYYSGDSSPAVTYSCVEGAFPGVANISLPPLFADADNEDYSLLSGSPCINKGTAVGAPVLDILGIERPQDLLYDMGAYEYVAK